MYTHAVMIFVCIVSLRQSASSIIRCCRRVVTSIQVGHGTSVAFFNGRTAQGASEGASRDRSVKTVHIAACALGDVLRRSSSCSMCEIDSESCLAARLNQETRFRMHEHISITRPSRYSNELRFAGDACDGLSPAGDTSDPM